MQRLAKTPLIVGADFEHGASMRMVRTTPFPYMMAFGAANDLELTRALGAATAREARAMGIHWIFAPDADVNNNPDNPIINIRSFGENPQAVASHVKAFIEGAHSDPAKLRACDRQALPRPWRHRYGLAYESAPDRRFARAPGSDGARAV